MELFPLKEMASTSALLRLLVEAGTEVFRMCLARFCLDFA